MLFRAFQPQTTGQIKKVTSSERTRISYLTALTSATYVVLPKENHMQLTEAATLDRKSGEAEGSAVPRTLPGNVFDRAHRSGEPAPACRGIRGFFSVLSHPLRVAQDVSPGSALKA